MSDGFEELFLESDEIGQLAAAYKTKYYIDVTGRYLGGYAGPDADSPYKDAIEIDAPPENAADVWNGSTWIKAKFPNIEGLSVALVEDETLGPVGFQLVKDFKLLLKDYLTQGEYGQQWIYKVWEGNIKPSLDAVHPSFAGIVLGHAAANNIQLVPPKA